jgi:hypothetical protein
MLFKVVITDETGRVVFETIIDSDNLLNAGIKAEDIYDQYHLEYPCEHCKHKCRVKTYIKKRGKQNE